MLATFDELAELTVDPDSELDAIRHRYDSDEFRMSGVVYSAALGKLVNV